MRRIAATFAALALAFAAGCGDEEQGEPIPAQDAEALLEQLDGIESQVDAGNCGSAEFQITRDGELQDKVAALPEDVDADVRSALEDGVDRLLELVEDQCGEDEEEQPDTDTSETDEEPPATDETDTGEEPPPTDTGEEPTDTGTQPDETDTGTQPESPGAQPPPPSGDDDGGAGPGAGGDGGAPAPNANAGRGAR